VIRVIGVTGGIASGKSTLLGLLRREGVPGIDSDRIVHRLLRRGTAVYSDVAAAFGEAYLGARGEIDRRKLGRTVFASRAARRKLERIVHPAVFAQIAEEAGRLRRRGHRRMAVDVPLLFETRADEGVDVVAVAHVPRAVQVRRLLARGHTRAEATARIGSQLSLDWKRRRADKVFDMTKPINQVRQEVRAWLKQLS